MAATSGVGISLQSSYLKDTLFIAKAGLRLRMSEVSIATAIQFYHTFKQKMDSTQYNSHLVAMATMFLAAKVQEVPVRLSDLVNTCYRCLHSDKPVLEVGGTYWKLKDSVANMELLVLRAIKFQMFIDLPHKYLLHHLLSLYNWVDTLQWTYSNIVQLSWSLLQDSFHTLLHVHYPPNTVSVAVLYLAVHCTKLYIPSDGSHRTWWEVMCPDVSIDELKLISETIMTFYDAPENIAS